MDIDEQIFSIQQYYPRIYMACHQDHERIKSNQWQLSSRDSTLLAHLSDDAYASPSSLAKHLQVTQATISEALAHLIDLGYIRAKTDENDARRQRLSLTSKGKNAIGDTSVLDKEKLSKLLNLMSDNDRSQAVEGLRLLANAALHLSNS